MPDLGDGFGVGWRRASDPGDAEDTWTRQAAERRAAVATELRAWLVRRSARRAQRRERLAALGAESTVGLVVGSAMQAARLSSPSGFGRSLQRYPYTARTVGLAMRIPRCASR
jgi:hypothetical protein